VELYGRDNPRARKDFHVWLSHSVELGTRGEKYGILSDIVIVTTWVEWNCRRGGKSIVLPG